jgi:CBS domain-containing protein
MEFVPDILGRREFYSARVGDSVADVAKRMRKYGIGAILVFDQAELKGLFSERDVLTRVVAEGRDPELTRVAEVMTTDVIAIDETASVEHAAGLMLHYNLRHLPVLQGERVIGVISMRDLLPRAVGSPGTMGTYSQSIC